MKNARRVTREEFGDAWPLTVDACWLRRHPHIGALMVQVQRGRARYRVYALNGIAIDQGYRDIRPIHAVAVESPYDGEPDVRKSLRPLIKAAQQIGGVGEAACCCAHAEGRVAFLAECPRDDAW